MVVFKEIISTWTVTEPRGTIEFWRLVLYHQRHHGYPIPVLFRFSEFILRVRACIIVPKGL
jgi:hypothetical protein